MATATTWAQDIITCDLNCDKPVQQFCNSCQVGLCEDCINKHVKGLKSMKHDIVPFTKRTVQLVFPQCTSHSHQRCEGHCQQCDVPVCMKCVMSSQHKGHDIVDMADIITAKKERIKRETEEIEGDIISKNKKQDSDVEKISTCTAHFSGLIKKGKDQRKQWHLEVDDIFDHLDTLTQSLRDYQITALKSYQSQLRSQNSSMIQTVEENKEILKSNNVSDVNNYKSKLTEFRNIPQVPDVTLPSLKTNTIQGRELSLELEEYKAKLTQSTLSSLTDEASNVSITELLKEAKVITNISANIEPLYKVACAGSDRAWINGTDKMLRCVDIYGTVTDSVTSTCMDFPGDITVNRQGELIYSDAANRTVNIVRHGKIETLITTPRGWHP
ncbi:tripartite motif-containing protein 45-like [Ostrea edulis]|uniref:tripartite motif-containing protein 45-like n=1 Tax=Ostrea edulis TaxID=37623 RepID=UPI0024AFB8DB|nr:tripartite motif-containing protein 45-like [Ostrea edulis]